MQYKNNQYDFGIQLIIINRESLVFLPKFLWSINFGQEISTNVEP